MPVGTAVCEGDNGTGFGPIEHERVPCDAPFKKAAANFVAPRRDIPLIAQEHGVCPAAEGALDWHQHLWKSLRRACLFHAKFAIFVPCAWRGGDARMRLLFADCVIDISQRELLRAGS